MRILGKTWYRIESNSLDELVLDSKVLKAGQDIIILRGNRIEPYASFDTVFYGELPNCDTRQFQLLNHLELDRPGESIIGLGACLPEGC